MILILLVFNFFIRTSQKLDLFEGLVLIFIYIVFIFLEFGLQMVHI